MLEAIQGATLLISNDERTVLAQLEQDREATNMNPMA